MDKKSSGWRRFVPVATLIAVITAMLGGVVATGMAEPAGTPPLDLNEAFLLLAIGLIAGIFGGLVGVGGATIVLPIMYFYLGFPEPIAIGTGLFVVIFTSISGAYGHLIRKNVDRRAAVWIAAGGLGGVLLGSWLFVFLVEHIGVLGLILGTVFLVPALNMVREGLWPERKSEPVEEGVGGAPPALSIFGIGVGILTGITGLGGGYALVPGMIYLFGAPVYITMGTSLAAMLPMALVGGGIKVFQGFVALGAGLILAAGSVIGAQLGAATIKHFSPRTLKLIFGLYFVYVAFRFIAEFFGAALP